jgi:predicted secreted protein
MTKLRKSKLDVVKPSYVLKRDESFVISHESNRKTQEDREIYRKARAAMKADGFVVRKKFKTFAEARKYAKKANQKYGAKFGVTVSMEIPLLKEIFEQSFH